MLRNRFFFPPTLRLILGSGAERKEVLCGRIELAGDWIWLRTPLYQFSLHASLWHEKLLPDTHCAVDLLLDCLPFSVMSQNNPPPLHRLCQTFRSLWHRSDWLGEKGIAQFNQWKDLLASIPRQNGISMMVNTDPEEMTVLRSHHEPWHSGKREAAAANQSRWNTANLRGPHSSHVHIRLSNSGTPCKLKNSVLLSILNYKVFAGVLLIEFFFSVHRITS